jgi:multiple sugar transport system permease protein
MHVLHIIYQLNAKRGGDKMSNMPLSRTRVKSRKTPKGHNPSDSGSTLTGYLMILPVIILLSVFVVIPLIYALKVSFTDWSFYMPQKFVGTKNYRLVLTDPNFIKSIYIGLKFALFVIPIQFVITFLFAHVLKSLNGKLGGFVKTSIYIPYVISGIVASCIFIFMYDYQGGILNYLLGLIGIQNQAWLAEPSIALLAIAVPAIWLGFGYVSLIMLSGLNDIPNSYYEVAQIEGANFLQKLYYITIPSMKNVFIFIFVTGITGAIQQFDLPFMMTGGGPLNETTTPVLLIFQHFTTDPTMGYTVAAALILFVVLGTISAIIFKVINSEKAMDD